MDFACWAQSPLPGSGRLIDRLTDVAAQIAPDQVAVASAYATVAGVRAFEKALASTSFASRWLIGIDDAITQPGALKLLLAMPGATVRWAALGKRGCRFHPKVIFLQRRTGTTAALMVGSANLTAAAFNTNAEVAAFLKADSKADVAALRAIFEELWPLGQTPTLADIDEYEKRFKRAEAIRRKLSKQTTAAVKNNRPILSNDDARVDPSLARFCWIECGSNTAMGRELELKAEQGLFFGLPQTGGPPKTFNFKVSNGASIPLRLKYQDNHMWRLQLNSQVPEVEVGLRPKLPNGRLGRSPYVAVIERTGAVPPFSLRFLKDDSKAFDRLIGLSKSTGTYGRTSARQFGWAA